MKKSNLMEKDEILKLIQEAIAPILESVKTVTTNQEKLTPLVGQLNALTQTVSSLEELATKPPEKPETKEEKQDPTPVNDNESPAVLALKAQIEQLQKAQQVAEAKAQAAKVDALMQGAIAKSGTKLPGVLDNVLRSRFGSGLVEQNGTYFVKDSAGVLTGFDDAVAQFMGSDEGKALLPPVSGTGAASGTGIQQGGSAPLSTQKAAPKTAAEAFERMLDL